MYRAPFQIQRALWSSRVFRYSAVDLSRLQISFERLNTSFKLGTFGIACVSTVLIPHATTLTYWQILEKNIQLSRSWKKYNGFCTGNCKSCICRFWVHFVDTKFFQKWKFSGLIMIFNFQSCLYVFQYLNFFPWHPGYVVNFKRCHVSKLWYRSSLSFDAIHRQDRKYHGNTVKDHFWVKSSWGRPCWRIIRPWESIQDSLTCINVTSQHWYRAVMRSMPTQQRTILDFHVSFHCHIKVHEYFFLACEIPLIVQIYCIVLSFI